MLLKCFKLSTYGLTIALMTCVSLKAQRTVKGDYPIQPVDFTRVHVHDHFWAPKMETNVNVTIPYVLDQCKSTGRIDNFLRAAKKLPGDKLTTFPFDDTDIYKVI